MASVKKVKEGGIFKYFKDKEDYWVCQIKDGDKLCGVKTTKGDNKLKGTRSSNLKRHLQRAHPAEKLLLDQQEAEAKSKADIFLNKKINNIIIRFLSIYMSSH